MQIKYAFNKIILIKEPNQRFSLIKLFCSDNKNNFSMLLGCD